MLKPAIRPAVPDVPIVPIVSRPRLSGIANWNAIVIVSMDDGE